MLEAGILEEDNRVELLDGLLVTTMTKNPPHTVVTEKLRRSLERALPPDFSVSSQQPVTTADSEPEPDVMIIRGQHEDYLRRHPSPSEVPLVVEVSDDSLTRDRGQKLAVYARAGIARYWIVNLRKWVVEAYADPTGATYRTRRDYAAGSSIPLVIDGAEVASISVDSFLPRR
jgi:Uma2 family endonuclease